MNGRELYEAMDLKLNEGGGYRSYVNVEPSVLWGYAGLYEMMNLNPLPYGQKWNSCRPLRTQKTNDFMTIADQDFISMYYTSGWVFLGMGDGACVKINSQANQRNGEVAKESLSREHHGEAQVIRCFKA